MSWELLEDGLKIVDAYDEVISVKLIDGFTFNSVTLTLMIISL